MDETGRVFQHGLGPLSEMRERLFYALFFRLSFSYARCVPPICRVFIELFILVKAIFVLFILIYVHVMFSTKSSECLTDIPDWPKDGILRVELSLEDSTLQPWSLTNQHYLNQSLLYQNQEFIATTTTGKLSPPNSLLYYGPKRKEDVKYDEEESMNESDDFYNKNLTVVMEYALEYGFLRLTNKTRIRLNVPIRTINLNKSHLCFGKNIIQRLIVEEFLGYDEILMSSFKKLAETQGNKGFLHNLKTGEHFRFVSIRMARSSYVVSFILMLTFTMSIAMLLRFSHQFIFCFIVQLLQVLEVNAFVIFPVAPLLTVILALVGVEAIMSEFFNDASTSFYVILMVWIADQYDALCSHTRITRRYWLRFFYVYLYLFYAYHYRFNGQHSGLALLAAWLFIQHSMIYFFHHYELPAVIFQMRIIADVPGNVHGNFAFLEHIGTQNAMNGAVNNNQGTLRQYYWNDQQRNRNLYNVTTVGLGRRE